VAGKKVADGLAKGAGALSVNQSYARKACEKRGVQVLLDTVARLVCRLPEQQDFGCD